MNAINKYKNAQTFTSAVDQLLFVLDEVIKLLYQAKIAMEKNDYEKKFKTLETAADVLYALRVGCKKVIENLFRDSISVKPKSKEPTGSTFALVRMNDRLNSKLYCKPFNLKFDVKSINNNDDDNKPKISIENITLTTSEMKNGQRVEKTVYSTVRKFDNNGNEIENKNKDFAKCEFRNGYHYVEIMKGEYAGMRFTYIPGLVEKDFQEIYDITPQEGAGNRMQAALGTLVNSKNPTKGAIPDALKAGADQIAKDVKEQERLESRIVDISDVLTGQINFINSITDMMLNVEKDIIKNILLPDSR